MPPTGPLSVIGRLVADQAEQQRPVAALACGVEGRLEGDRPLGQRAGLVGEEDLDVAQILDGDQPLDQDLLARPGPREPADRLTLTMAGIISGAIPTAMARENSRASISGRCRTTLMMKIGPSATMATVDQELGETSQPGLKAGLGVPVSET